MVRGNWQKRVERAQDRRDLARNIKIRKNQRSLFKSLVQNELWPLLEKIAGIDSDSPLEVLHVWVDCLPRSRVRSADLEEEDSGAGSIRRNKIKNKKKTKVDASPISKKSHPRSHENLENGDEMESQDLLCHDFFFSGACRGFSKGGKSKKNAPQCKHQHYLSKKYLTLADALSMKPYKQKKQTLPASSTDTEKKELVLERASNAAHLAQRKLEGLEISADMSIESAGIDMLHYIEISLIPNQGKTANAINAIMTKFSAENVNIGAIAYVVYSNVLLFDRFDGGVVISPEVELTLFGDTSGINKGHAISDALAHFPGTILEHILCYLPNLYAGILPRVCKSLHRETGTASPQLWKMLTQRNGWPTRTFANPNDDLTSFHKTEFLSHHRICQRLESFNEGMKKLTEKHNMRSTQNTAIQIFQGKSCYPSGALSLVLWNEHSVLVAARGDCILHLYKTCRHLDKDKSLREIFSMRVAPVPFSRKIQCLLESIVLDDVNVACLFSVNGEHVVASITKDDLLSNSTEDAIEGNDILVVHVLTKFFLEHCAMSNDPNLVQYDGEENVDVKLIDKIKACGTGIFCAIIKIVRHHDDDAMFGIISLDLMKGRSTIVDFFQLPSSFHSSSPKLTTNYHLKERVDPIEVTCKNSCKSDLLFVLIDKKGNFQESKVLYQGPLTKILNGSWNLLPPSYTSTHTVRFATTVATTYVLHNIENSENRIACIFYSTEADVTDTTVIFLEREYESILSTVCMHEDYLVLFCGRKRRDMAPVINGHWFGDDFDSTSESSKLIDLIIVHVPTKKELQCTTFDISRSFVGDFKLPIFFDVGKKCTIVGLVDDVGICLSGASLINATASSGETSTDETPKAVKKVKKKKRLAATKSGKKDGFARGQGLRGG